MPVVATESSAKRDEMLCNSGELTQQSGIMPSITLDDTDRFCSRRC
jgi:hypothetical protein